MLGYSVKFIILTLFTFLFFSCDDCRDIACTSPPKDLSFVIKDAEIKDHIRDIYGPQLVTIEDSNGDFLDLNVRDQRIYYSESIGWQTGSDKKAYTLHVGDKSYSFIYHTEDRTEGCCDLIDLVEFNSTELIINKLENEDLLSPYYIEYEFLIDYK